MPNQVGMDQAISKKIGSVIVAAMVACTASLSVRDARADDASTSASPVKANVQNVPQPILRTGTQLNTVALSANAVQLAQIIGVTPLLQRIDQLRSDPESREFLDLKLQSLQILQQTALEVDFVRANIDDEVSVIREILATAINRRDRKVALTNAASFITNGILWTVAEAATIPSYAHPRLSIPSGTVGILAGLAPSLASIYALKLASGGKQKFMPRPNMLCKIFDQPTDPETDLPEAVWDYLVAVPPGDASGLTRRDQIINRWIADDNIASFTDRHNKEQIALITGTSDKPLTVTIEVLVTRQTMLEQLCSEVFKMKRLLLELNMVVSGKKRI